MKNIKKERDKGVLAVEKMLKIILSEKEKLSEDDFRSYAVYLLGVCTALTDGINRRN